MISNYFAKTRRCNAFLWTSLCFV